MRAIDFSPNAMTGQSERLPHEAYGWIMPLARFGFVSQGVVYGIICSLAAPTTASHCSGRTSGPQGALVAILSQPFGATPG
jgi:Domain of Unknown Function (DUF1206)